MTTVLERPIVETRREAVRTEAAPRARRVHLPYRPRITHRRIPWGVAYGPDSFARCAERVEIIETTDLAP